ncbi:PREDICTED: SUMO-activating enzyme subunit 2-like [Amphimedon queenslandica]|uniref:SUMO-activating enzyme subunit n=1 Tax=Amphimedon queenslandica TaxID=400682 RepID=A0A1X7VUT8_AMPQE|nr:PREDICTED: SUMO-activating enzyme subunit 2-like [Amphimedon queenslandica]|eukprot:XP_011402782.1 PREDICTED: SUMO-activating enzyme subunit 2-like [Amphimedon queenslandica]
MADCLNESLRNTVSTSKVLVVGAGGIGCELIKNLVLTGFKNLVIVDLDTIDVSNLNRQFLFQKDHVGRPKVEVARESALAFNPTATITAIHDSILNPEYNISFYKQFALVMNALDNKKARNHVNRLCLAAGITLVESGSAGYLGQVTVIRKGASECYECQPKPAPKTFPGCTIRNTPSEPIHCIVWAKHLYSQLFGEPDADNDVSPDTALENGEVMEAENEVVQRVSTRQWVESKEYNPEQVFEKLFVSDIEYLLSMEKLWQTRQPPMPLKAESLLSSSDENDRDMLLPDQRIWSVAECVKVFMKSLPVLRERQLKEGELIWDKDDHNDLDFVVATANLRCHTFGIQLKSKFDIKSMAGNIIPAIATTNAVIAGLIVMEALKILDGQFNKCKTTYLPKNPNPRKRLLVTCPLLKPNPKCYVCSPCPEASVKLNTNSTTIATLRDKIIIGHFGMIAPDVEIDDGKGTILISSEEGETDDNLPKFLGEFNISGASRLKVDDFLQNYQLILNLFHSDEALSDEKEFEVISDDNIDEARLVKRKAEDDIESTSKKQRTDYNNSLIQ